MSKVYLVTYNADMNFNQAIFHNFIGLLYQRGFITDWWHYIDTGYLVVTLLEVNDLYNAIYPGIPQRNLLIVEINPNNAQGWLPKDAWTWLQKYQTYQQPASDLSTRMA